MELKKRVMAALTVILVIAGCGPAEVTETTATDSTESSQSGTTTLPGGTTEPETSTTTGGGEPKSKDCLAEPVAEGDREDVGEVGEIDGTAEVDCEEVFGGEALERQAVVATDDVGRIGFGLELADADCDLTGGGVLELLPDDETAFQIDAGVLICTFHGGVDSVEMKAGETVARTTVERRLTKALLIVDGDETRVIVIEGFVVVDPAEGACRSVVGPTEEIQVGAGGSPTIRQLDPSGIPGFWRSSFGLTDAMLSPEPGPELLPGLRELVESDQVTVLFDGDVVSEADDMGELLPVLEAVTASDVEVEPSGQITIIEAVEGPTAPAAGPPMESPAIDSVSSVVEIDSSALGDALDQEAAVEPAVSELFIDPDGHRWAVAFDATDAALEGELVSAIRDQLYSGAFGAFYRSEFGVGPDYDTMFPDLMEGSTSCRS